jgi:hypothetical protein
LEVAMNEEPLAGQASLRTLAMVGFAAGVITVALVVLVLL